MKRCGIIRPWRTSMAHHWEEPMNSIPTNSTTNSTTTANININVNINVRPQPGENAPYYDRYISLVPGNDVLAALDEQRRQTLLLLSGLTEADADLHYAPENRSLNEVIVNLTD